MYDLNEKLAKLEPYNPISGEFKIRLDANESFFTQDNSEIFSKLNKIDLNRYPDPYAKRVCEKFGEFYGVSSDNVTAGNGSDELISVITSCFLQKGDNVLCFEPDFSMYFFYPRLYELNIHKIAKNSDMAIDIDAAVENCRKKDIKCVLISNPCNPTSVGIEGDQIERFVKALCKIGTLAVIDEAYMEFWDKRESLLGKINDYDNLIVLKTCSKAIGLAGIRLGFAVACSKITKALRAAKSPYNVNSITQEIGAIVFENKTVVEEKINAIISSRDSLLGKLKGLDSKNIERIYDSKTNFLFIKVRDSENIKKELAKNSIAVSRQGECLRITCGNEKENNAFIKAFEKIDLN